MCSSLVGIASLVNVSIPRVLVTSTSFYVQWSYPELLVNPLIVDNNPAEAKNVLISISSIHGDTVSPVSVDQSTTSINITEGIMSDTKYTISVNIDYNNPNNFKGEEVTFEIQTLPESMCAHNNYSILDKINISHVCLYMYIMY